MYRFESSTKIHPRVRQLGRAANGERKMALSTFAWVLHRVNSVLKKFQAFLEGPIFAMVQLSILIRIDDAIQA